MAELDSENPEETVAVGDLFKLGGSKGGRRTWNLRRFYLRGASLIYYSLEGQKKGSWDVRNCIVRFTTPDECNMPDAIFSFAVVGPNKFFVMCASNERSRTIWMKTLADQIQEFKRDVRIFLRRGEVVIADARVKKKGGLFGSYSVIRLIITNFPKILVVDPVTCALREQRSWKKEESPRFAVISEHRFKVTVQGKELDFEDVDKGSTYWQTIFKRFQDVQIDLFVKKENKPIQVDAPAPESERKTSTAPPITPMQIDDIQTSANMEMGDIELSSSNLKVLQGAIENVKELATAISARIIAIDEEIDWEMEARDPVLAASAAAFREQRKQELQVLNDNVVVMSANLENLVTMTLNNDPSAKNVDITAVEKVYEETSAMILMLSYDEDRKMPADEMLSQEDLAVEENIRASVVSRSVRVDSAPDVVITEENFDANDLRCRPPHWNDIRVKRVVIKEIADRLLGLTEEEIVDRRAERISQEESEMISEVVIHGRLLNSDCIRAVHRSDCDAVFAPSVDTLSQQRSVLEASVLITPDNFQADSADVRPSGWNALRARRAYLKEAAQRALGVTSEDLNHTYNLRVAEVCNFIYF